MILVLLMTTSASAQVKDSLMGILSGSQEDVFTHEVYLKLSDEFVKEYQYEEANKYLDKALKLSEDLGQNSLKIQSLQKKVNLLYKKKEV